MQNLIRPLVSKSGTKIVLVVLDGLGGLPKPTPDPSKEGNIGKASHEGNIKEAYAPPQKTELEAADTPNLDAIARVSACGLHMPVGMGITPGSGPGHLSLFGYDPVEFQIGRGILEALGLGLEVRDTDIALRCNYATLKDGVIADRRAGRIPTPDSKKLTERLASKIKKIDDAEIIFSPGMEHRFAVILRFPKPLSPGAGAVNDTDPQKEGASPIPPRPMNPQAPQAPQAEKTARVAEKLIEAASEVLKGQERANYILLRGFSAKPSMPTFEEAYGLRALAIAAYPMYRGVAKLVGMKAPDLEGGLKEEVETLKKNFNDYDFFFLHVKKVDSYGEDGNFEEKAKRIEEADAIIPDILKLNPDVLMVTGDHSTPAVMKGHSWHPVPFLLHSPYVLGGTCNAFSERECLKGELGIFPSVNIMPLALANAGRLKKFGA